MAETLEQFRERTKFIWEPLAKDGFATSPGCANKVGLSCSNTTLSALMALEGFSIEAGGIVGTNEPGQLTKNLGRVANVGMKDANATIVDIMMGR